MGMNGDGCDLSSRFISKALDERLFGIGQVPQPADKKLIGFLLKVQFFFQAFVRGHKSVLSAISD